jgi:hypothetical protein
MISGEVGGICVPCSFGAIMCKDPAVIPLSETVVCMKQVLSKEIQSKCYTVKPLCIIFQGDGKQKQYIRENDSTGKLLKIIDKSN